jgi:hypothetical protein
MLTRERDLGQGTRGANGNKLLVTPPVPSPWSREITFVFRMTSSIKSPTYCVFTIEGKLVGEYESIHVVAVKLKTKPNIVREIISNGSIFKKKFYVFEKEQVNNETTT